jgi:hypothetical protein
LRRPGGYLAGTGRASGRIGAGSVARIATG